MNKTISVWAWQHLCKSMQKEGAPKCRTEFLRLEKRIMRLARLDATHTIGMFAAFSNECFSDLDTMTNEEKFNDIVMMMSCISKDTPLNPFVWDDMCQMLASMGDAY